MKNTPKNLIEKCTLVVAVAFGVAITSPVSAATIQMTGSDSPTQSSYDTGANWSDGLAPSSGNDYVVDGYTIRVTTQNVTFQGDSLTLTNNAVMNVKTTSGVTTNSFIVNGGRIVLIQQPATFMFGNLTIGESGAILDPQNGEIYMNMVISGTGALTADTGGDASTMVRIRRTNSYTGGTSVLTGILNVEADGGLGAGNVLVAAGATLTLNQGTTNDYIDDSARLALDSTSLLNLDYTGTDTIAGLSFDGGGTYVQLGVWGAIGNPSAEYTSSLITGDGLLHVIPEANAYSLLMGISAFLMLIYRRRLKSQ